MNFLDIILLVAVGSIVMALLVVLFLFRLGCDIEQDRGNGFSISENETDDPNL